MNQKFSERDFSDIINVLWSQIMGCMEVEELSTCLIYLESACQKHLFAEKRLNSIKSKIQYRKCNYSVVKKDGYNLINLPQNRFSISMDFDHCILSLRSSLEHLAQLFNASIPLGLPSRGRISESASLENVIKTTNTVGSFKSNTHLSELLRFLQAEINKDWYKELHDLRITQFHDKAGKLPETMLQTLNHVLIDLKFLLPSETVSSAKNENDRDIVVYCTSRVKDVKRLLYTCFLHLSNYLTDKFGTKWLEE